MPTLAPHRSHTSVLIVDDDAFMRDLIVETLAALGITRIDTAADGRAAMRWLQQADALPSLLISDIYMPDMDGFEFISALAELHYPGKVLLCSGVSIESLALARDVAEGLGVPLAGVVEKPLNAGILADILDKNGL